jgi:hypothetical protein
MTADELVYWAVTGVVGGAAGISIMIAAWLLKGHLSLLREFDQFKGEVRSTYATPHTVKEAVASAIKPLEREVERLIAHSEHIGDFLRELAQQTHINPVRRD